MLPGAQPWFLKSERICHINTCGIATDTNTFEWYAVIKRVGYQYFIRKNINFPLIIKSRFRLSSNGKFFEQLNASDLHDLPMKIRKCRTFPHSLNSFSLNKWTFEMPFPTFSLIQASGISLSVWTRWETTTLPSVNSPISPVSDAIGPLASKTLEPLLTKVNEHISSSVFFPLLPFLEMIKLLSHNQIVSGSFDADGFGSIRNSVFQLKKVIRIMSRHSNVVSISLLQFLVGMSRQSVLLYQTRELSSNPWGKNGMYF